MNTTRGVILGVAIVSVMSVSGFATANQSMIYGGDWCVPANETETGVSYFGTLTSASGTTEVICPILRQIGGNTTAFASAQIEGYAPSGGTVDCTLSCRSHNGDVIDMDSDSFSGPGDGVINLTDPGNGAADGVYDLRCTLVGTAAKLYNYEVVEYCANCTAQDDAKVLPGHACRAAYASNQDDMNYNPTGAIWNESSIQYVECPWFKDNRSDEDGLLFMSMYVEEPASSQMSCTAYAYDHDGDQWDLEAFSPPATGIDQIEMEPGPDSLSGGYYFVRCYTPYNGKIYSLYGVESGGGTP